MARKIIMKNDKEFITFADLPPNPTNYCELDRYMNLGFSVCLLTEDAVKMIDCGILSFEYKTAIENIAKSGMQVWIRNMYNDPDYFICKKDKKGSNYGEPYQLQARKITDEFSAFNSVTGFYMADEPYMYSPQKTSFRWKHKDSSLFTSFDELEKLVEWRNKYYPHFFFHINHVGSMSYDHFFPQNTTIYDYSDFLDFYATKILRKVEGNKKDICLDSYPFLDKDTICDNYLYDLLTGAMAVKKYNDTTIQPKQAIFGLCLQTFHLHSPTDDRHRDIYSVEEITFQMFTGFALGARLFEYFCYRSYSGGLDGILRMDGSERIYDLVKKANEQFLWLGEVSYHFRWTGSFVCAGEKICDNALAFIKAKHLFIRQNVVEIKSDYDSLIGCFEKEDTLAYALVNFTDPIRQQMNIISIKTNFNRATIYYNKIKTIKNTCDGLLQIVLHAGEGAFIVFDEQ